MTVTSTASGGRKVQFYVPQKISGTERLEIELRPPTLDLAMRWKEGAFGHTSGAMAVLAELSGWDETRLRQLTFPDADRVMSAFMDLIPAVMAEDIRGGKVPESPAGGPFVYPEAEEEPEGGAASFEPPPAPQAPPAARAAQAMPEAPGAPPAPSRAHQTALSRAIERGEREEQLNAGLEGLEP